MVTHTSNNVIIFEVAVTACQVKKAKQLCHDVYLNIGYIDKPFPGRVIPYEFDADSIYIVALNKCGDVIGTMRMTAGPPFKTLNIWKDKLLPSALSLIHSAATHTMYEIGALAVKKDHSSLKISWGLYKTFFQVCHHLGIENVIMNIDHRVLRSLEMLGWKVVRIGEPMMYFGSLTVPGILPLNEQAVAISAKNKTYNNYLAA